VAEAAIGGNSTEPRTGIVRAVEAAAARDDLTPQIRASDTPVGYIPCGAVATEPAR
jgi:hypothetical protein